jgi:hypothetical protein
MNCSVCLATLDHADDHDRCETFERTLRDAFEWAIDVIAEELPSVQTPAWLEAADSLFQE